MSLTRAQLPVRLTPLVGRASELGDVVDAIDRSRLITLTEPGGAGKTRLALAAAKTAGESFPAGVHWVAQTQVTGLNDEGVTVGFWSTMNSASMVNTNFGFFSVGGRSYRVNFPTGNNASPQVDQLLGVNDHDVAAGFYTNAQGNNRGYEYNIRTRHFTRVLVPGHARLHLAARARVQHRGRPARHRDHPDQRRERQGRPGRVLHRRQRQHRRHDRHTAQLTSLQPGGPDPGPPVLRAPQRAGRGCHGPF
jgi:hypothetical protein